MLTRRYIAQCDYKVTCLQVELELNVNPGRSIGWFRRWNIRRKLRHLQRLHIRYGFSNRHLDLARQFEVLTGSIISRHG